MQLSNSSFYAVRPDTFSEFDNGFTFVPNCKYERYNQMGIFVKDVGEYRKQLTKLSVRVIAVCDNKYLIDKHQDKLKLGFNFPIIADYLSANTIYTSTYEQFKKLYYDIQFDKLKCIGILKDITVSNDVELIFIAYISNPPNDSLKMSPQDMRDNLLSLDRLSRFILEQINYIM